jgi:hypothetical protein
MTSFDIGDVAFLTHIVDNLLNQLHQHTRKNDLSSKTPRTVIDIVSAASTEHMLLRPFGLVQKKFQKKRSSTKKTVSK